MSLIEECFKLVIDSASQGDRDSAIVIEDSCDPEKWVQISWDYINAAYPFTDFPITRFTSLSIDLPNSLELSDWSAERYVTFQHGAEPLGELAHFVEQYFSKILNSQPGQLSVGADQ